MGLFDKFFKKMPQFECRDNEVVAIAKGKMIDITTISDEMFAKKMMGDGIAFTYDQDEVTISSPANGTLSVLFPTGHAFGITLKNGVELLVHIGIDTVSANGDGFTLCSKKQGELVKAGDPIVKVNMKKLKSQFDMPVMLIVTNPNGNSITMPEPKDVEFGEALFTI